MPKGITVTNKKFDVTNKNCPSHNVLGSISDKWSILIINTLTKGAFRFGALKRELNISPKMLWQTLQKLEKFQLQDYQELPLRVEYSLTNTGLELSGILTRLSQWTEKNMDSLIQLEEQTLLS